VELVSLTKVDMFSRWSDIEIITAAASFLASPATIQQFLLR
jgi:hypothetical protein